MILEAFNPEHFGRPERAPLAMIAPGMLIELPEHPPYLIVGPVSRDGYRRDGHARAVLFADRVTRDGQRGSLTIRCAPGQLFTIRRPLGLDIA